MVILRDNKVLISLEKNSGIEDLIRVKRALYSMLINIDTGSGSINLAQDVSKIAWLLDCMEFNDDQSWQIEQEISKNKEFAEHFINPTPDNV